ncbi:MAG: GAF domain-containing protein, partial [Spirochaetaceae bacterium]|nr:GAF domain-containing protein [Spirochaetaceae bacterium]
LTQAQSAVRGYLYTGDPSFIDGYDVERTAWLAHLREIRAHRTDRLTRAQEATGKRWLDLYGDPVRRAVAREGALEEVRATRDVVAAKESFDTYRGANERLEESLGAELQSTQLRGAAVRRAVTLLLLLATATSLLFGLVAAWSTVHHLLRPLVALRETVRRLAGGESEARADVSRGPVEVLALGEALNALADESDRSRAADQHGEWMRRLAHDVGLRIRDGLDADTVVRTAVGELGSSFGVDRVILRLVHGDRLAPLSAEWHEIDVAPLGRRTLDSLAEDDSTEWPESLWAAGKVFALVDLDASSGTPAAEPLRQLARDDGARSALLVPVGAGAELLGTLTLLQMGHSRPWSPAETIAVQAIAADLGRSLRHALLYAQERLVVDQLRVLDRSKTDFLSTVSHELRTPLTSITGYVELLRFGDAGVVSDEQVRMLDVIDRSAGRLRALIEDLLTLSRIESGALRSLTEPVDVRCLAQAAVLAIEPSAAAEGVRLEVHLGESPLAVLGDPGQLDRVLLNLLSNAVKFSRAGGTVTVRTHLLEDEVVLTVSDTGIGIPAAEQDRLFTRFFRATNATELAIKGTGLGLTIVRSIIEHHHGTLTVSSTEGEGTSVEVRLRSGAAGKTATATFAAAK